MLEMPPAVKTIGTRWRLQAAITSGSLREPPGWIMFDSANNWVYVSRADGNHVDSATIIAEHDLKRVSIYATYLMPSIDMRKSFWFARNLP